jgi:dipeptidyl aminopeptidase/acylaminoacyl peptidase
MMRANAWCGIHLAAVSFIAAQAFANGNAPPTFTVALEIGLTNFGDPYTGEAEAVEFSPNGAYFAVNTERGRLDLNRPEGALGIYQTQEVRHFLRHQNEPSAPQPTWTLSRSTDKDGPIISDWHWLPDSSGIAFLERTVHGTHRLAFADVTARTVESLTPEGDDVRAFDIRDHDNYIYAVASRDVPQRQLADRTASQIVGTGRPLDELLFPVDQYPAMAARFDRSELWAVSRGHRIQVKNSVNGQPIILFNEGQRKFALSPDGNRLVTVLPIPHVPSSWEARYRPPCESGAYRVRSRSQDLETPEGFLLTGQYVLINVAAGTIHPLIDAPTSQAAGWWSNGNPAWSADGKGLLLPGSFVPFVGSVQSRPCVVFADIAKGDVSCVVSLTGRTDTGFEPNYREISEVRFFEGTRGQVVVSYYNLDGSQGTTAYTRKASGGWVVAEKLPVATKPQNVDIAVTVRESLNDPPTLVATDTESQISKVIWNPNGWLKDIELGEAADYAWTDDSGRTWQGTLYKPPHYQSDLRYPLVIQGHAFGGNRFHASGAFPTAFAARALSSVGIVVLQVQDCPIIGTPEEGPCNVQGYESGVRQLSREGVVDPNRVGVIGFSRTCFYVMEMLTASSAVHIRAASITDGVMADYLQYMTAVDLGSNSLAREDDVLIGAPPFGQGLEQWIRRSPLFNVEKIVTPLLVVAVGRENLPFMWGPYAALRYLHKPVDLIVLNDNQHVLTNPGARMASQGGSVDWFRFWLQDYEDPDPAKVEQYARWNGLRNSSASERGR